MEPFWILIVLGSTTYSLYRWNASNQRLQKYKQEQSLIKRFTDKATLNNPELINIYWKRKRSPIAKELRPSVYARTRGRCFYCDCNLSELPEWQVDHIWPYRFGGSDELINLVPACKDCNQVKWSYLPPRYFLHKWVVGKSFTSHENRFIDYYRTTSMSNLIGTSAHWKGMADYWHSEIYSDFAELITENIGVRKTSGREREDLQNRASIIWKKFQCDVVKERSSNPISLWIQNEELWERIQQQKHQEN